MRKAIIILAAAGVAASVGAGHKEVDDAWAGCTNYLPCNRNVKELISADYFYVHQLTSTQREKLYTDGGWATAYCYKYEEPAAREHSYIILKFDNDFQFEEITARFRARCEASGITVKLYAWDGENWDYVTANTGGNDPPIKTGDVSNYMGAQYMFLLLQVYTGTGAEAFDVTLGDLNYD